MIKTLKDVVKAVAVRTGAFNFYHQLTQRETLTVLMFHRVLPSEDIVRRGADPEYTIAIDQFRQFLQLLSRQYTFVSMRDLKASRERQRPLPNYAILVTFDDGWNDNFEYALPELAALGIPWTVFVATDPICAPARWWQETILHQLRSGRSSYEELWKLAQRGDEPADGQVREPLLALLLRYGSLREEQRETILKDFERPAREDERDMMTLENLRAIHAANVEVGIHGASHLPLTGVSDPAIEIVHARDFLVGELGHETAATMSFPHGRYDERVLRQARAVGLKLLFTSDPVLNDCPGGWLQSDLLGRIPIAGVDVSNSNSEIDSKRWMPHLYLRPRTRL
jgi:peptidoglycan/xylan/chitin deacetylase (PgdA/CDA1 family)